MKRLLNTLLWSVIAAAFIGPGTITTAARAGSDFRFALAWTLLFSVAACLVLQEASARITVLTGTELGEAIRRRYRSSQWGSWIPAAVAGGIVLGCAAYEAGNILGGVAGLRLVVDLPRAPLTIITGVLAAALLASGNTRWIARSLGALVALMGVAFLVTAVRLGPDLGALLSGLFIPSMPRGSSLLVLGLVGTTVVPYNLFFGLGPGAEQRPRRDAMGPCDRHRRRRGHLARCARGRQRPGRRPRLRAPGRGARRPARGRRRNFFGSGSLRRRLHLGDHGAPGCGSRLEVSALDGR